MPLDPDTHPSTVHLTVGDLDAMRAFYEQAIGLLTLDQGAGIVRLGVPGGEVLVELVEDPSAPSRPTRTTGLFHLALLVPSRAELAAALRRVVESGHRLTGASDHLVSEALYLDDPEGNGIELYRDRPRSEWRRDGSELAMATLPLDLDGLVAELPADDLPAMPAGTVMGHVHLNVSGIPSSRRFYTDVLGFDVTVSGYPQALFVSAGGYHHHLGLNTWNGVGAPPPPAGSRGLRAYELVVPGDAELGDVADSLDGAGISAEHGDHALSLADPSGNRLIVRTPSAALLEA